MPSATKRGDPQLSRPLMLYVKHFNCFVMLIQDLGPVTMVLVQMEGHVPHFAGLRGVVPGVLGAG